MTRRHRGERPVDEMSGLSGRKAAREVKFTPVVADRDDARFGQMAFEQAVKLAFGAFVDGRGGLVQKQPVGPDDQGPGDRDALLLPAGQSQRPVRVFAQTRNQMRQPDRAQRSDNPLKQALRP